MVIQPFVENAIIHGLLHREKDGILSILFERNENQVICTVEDNGIGRKRSGELNSQKATKHQSRGTEIAQKRLALLNDEERGVINKIVFEDLVNKAEPSGTRVIIYMPIL
jgi:sensor histidine kinase YesM